MFTKNQNYSLGQPINLTLHSEGRDSDGFTVFKIGRGPRLELRQNKFRKNKNSIENIEDGEFDEEQLKNAYDEEIQYEFDLTY